VVKTVTHEVVTSEELGGARVHSEESAWRTSRRPTTPQCLMQLRASCWLPAAQQRRGSAAPGHRRRPASRMDEALDTIVPRRPDQPYDMRQVVKRVVDDGKFFEVHARYAKNMVVGFARLGGRVVGIVGNQPNGARRRARHRREPEGRALHPLLRRVQHPARHLRGRAGLPAGLDQEWGGIIRHGAKLLYAYCEATVPKITVITRKAYGGAYDVMSSASTSAPTSTSPGRAPRSR
jgi:propionyl-CoA carboxylase beta chain